MPQGGREVTRVRRGPSWAEIRRKEELKQMPPIGGAQTRCSKGDPGPRFV